MSLVRNLTRRARAHTRGEDTSGLPRSCTVKYAPGTINRAKISLPTELLSTTNVDAMNAPDIRTLSSKASSSSDSMHSDSDFASIDRSFMGADNSSTSELSPLTPLTPFSDFGAGSESKDFFSSKPAAGTSGPSLIAEPTPAVPARAPSHSKNAHVELSRKLSVKRSMSPPPISLIEPSRDAPAGHSQVSPKSSFIFDQSAHPFSVELAKVDEVAEGFGSGMVLDEEEREMMSKGLRKFSVQDYVAELTGMHGGVYEDKLTLNPWM